MRDRYAFYVVCTIALGLWDFPRILRPESVCCARACLSYAALDFNSAVVRAYIFEDRRDRLTVVGRTIYNNVALN